ncbi:hypothetical protein Ahy_A02g007271 [Arachis hypogaea]|uniref:CCHC-type domain-containing protein n=1 Tax=Arachis hypogaea TaxID=3818 RepID=A0A445EBV4_ARAHY|nr:hypothetical protein Ahy_A02g007271 [Arachis hypogaea]
MMHGFAMRLDEVRHDSDGYVIMRQIVCNRRAQERKRLKRTKESGPPTPNSKLLLDENSVSDKAQAKNLHDIGIRTCHILGYLASQKGGYANLSFNQKDMYNLITQHRKENVKKETEGACAMNTELNIQDGGKLYFKCNSFGVPEIDHVVEFDRVGGEASLRVSVRWTKNPKSDFMKSNVDDPSDSDKSKGAPKKNSKFKQQRRCSNCGVTRHYNKSCPNVPGRIPKELIDILTKNMEKDRNIGGGITPTSVAKSAFTDQVKTSSPGLNIPVCASTSNEESGMSFRPAESPVVALETGMAD